MNEILMATKYRQGFAEYTFFFFNQLKRNRKLAFSLICFISNENWSYLNDACGINITEKKHNIIF